MCTVTPAARPAIDADMLATMAVVNYVEVDLLRVAVKGGLTAHLLGQSYDAAALKGAWESIRTAADARGARLPELGERVCDLMQAKYAAMMA